MVPERTSGEENGWTFQNQRSSVQHPSSLPQAGRLDAWRCEERGVGGFN